MAQAQPFEVHYHPHINVDVSASWDNFNYEHCTTDDVNNMMQGPRRKLALDRSLIGRVSDSAARLEDPAQTLPNGIFECQPSLHRIRECVPCCSCTRFHCSHVAGG